MRDIRKLDIVIGVGTWLCMTGMVLLMGFLMEFLGGIPFTFVGFLKMELLASLLMIPIICLKNILVEFFAALFDPNKHYDRPQPIYSHAEAFVLNGQYAEALLAYNAIAEDYPDLAKPYIAMMDIYDLHYHDKASARRIYEWAKTKVQGKRERTALEEAYREIVVSC